MNVWKMSIKSCCSGSKVCKKRVHLRDHSIRKGGKSLSAGVVARKVRSIAHVPRETEKNNAPWYKTVPGQDGWILVEFFLWVFYVEVDKNANKDRTSLVNKGFIICPKRGVFLAGPPRKIPHLARWGSQSERRIRFILPARGFSYIIKARLYPLW